MRFEKSLAVKQLRKYFPIFLALLVGFFSANVINLAFAHGGNINLIHGCVKGGLLNNGSLRIIAANGTCNSNETPLDWDVAGRLPFTCPNCTLTVAGDRYKGKNLSNAYLPGVNLSGGGTDLTGTNFTDGYLPSSNFSLTPLQGSIFVNVYAEDSVFSQANLTNANLSSANLRHTNFDQANLTNSNLTNVNFDIANLLGTIGLNTATRTGITWSSTTCPDGTNSNDNGNTCEGHLVP